MSPIESQSYTELFELHYAWFYGFLLLVSQQCFCGRTNWDKIDTLMKFNWELC